MRRPWLPIAPTSSSTMPAPCCKRRPRRQPCPPLSRKPWRGCAPRSPATSLCSISTGWVRCGPASPPRHASSGAKCWRPCRQMRLNGPSSSSKSTHCRRNSPRARPCPAPAGRLASALECALLELLMQTTQTIATKGQPVLTLPGAWYSDPEIFSAERTRIFGKSWQLAGPLSALQKPGDYMAIEILGWRVFVIRNREGALKAFHNVCRHRAGPLLDEGRGHCDVLRCRYHLWVYDTDGNLRRTPAFGEADWFDKKDYSLFPVKVATWRGLV